MKKFIFIGAILLFPAICSAAIFSDDFNDYTIDTQLNGQGSWTGNDDFLIQSTTTLEGLAVKATPGTELYVTKSGSTANDGTILVYYYISGTTDAVPQLTLFEGGDVRINLKLESNKVYYYSGGWQDSGVVFTDDTFFYLKIVWRASDHTYNLTNGEGTPSAQLTAQAAWSSGLNTLRLGSVSGSTDYYYFDYIAETPYEEPATTTPLAGGAMTFPEILIVVLAVFLICTGVYYGADWFEKEIQMGYKKLKPKF